MRRIALDREQILVANDAELEWVPVPEWAPPGAPDRESYGVYVRAISARERERLTRTSLVVEKGGRSVVDLPTFHVKLATIAMCDEHGRQLFTQDDVLAIGGKSSKVVERIIEAARRLSGLKDEEGTEDKEGRENPPSTMLNDSATDSASPSAE